MSTDFALAWQCPHLTIQERVRLAPDRRTLLTSQPVSATGLLRVTANDDVPVPQGGLLSAAQIHGSTSGPYDLPVGRRTLILASSSGTASIELAPPPGGRDTAASIASQVLAHPDMAGTGLVVEVVQGRLAFTDATAVGPASKVRVQGSAAFQIGFGDDALGDVRQRGARGRSVLPPWRLEVPQGRISYRQPRFVQAVRGDPVFRVSYAAPARACKRCGASLIENDLRVDPTGQAIMIRNEDLLYQAALKVLLTDRASNPFHEWYGTSIRSRIGSKSVGAVAVAIGEDVRRALARMQQLQTAQANYQIVSTRERLHAVLGVRVSPHAQDQTTFLIEVDVQNASQQPISISIVYTVPDVVALMGSNGLVFPGQESAGLMSDQLPSLLGG